MEAAFIDIGQGRNGVLYASEVDWKSAGLGGRSRRIEHALKSGDQVLVQVTKDPIGHKGARLSTQISLAGRYLVYVPGGRSAGISRKLPTPERKRLKQILADVVPGKGGAIIRTAAEGVSEEAIAADVNRLHNQWTSIQKRAEEEKNSKGAKPVTLYEEPNLLVKVVRDLFNEDFTSLIVDGRKPWNTVHAYVQSVAPDLLDRLEKFDRGAHEGKDAFEEYRVDEQISKALSRTVWLPSGGTLVIDRTEAMTVIDVNTGKFTGSGGSLEETVTSNNLEAAEEIVRQIRLRDIGGMIIIDFIDMILPENQDLVLRRLNEALGRDRTRHQVSEVTSLGLVQMTRKRVGTGLIETFSTECEACHGRGIIIHDYPVDEDTEEENSKPQRRTRKERRAPQRDPKKHPAAVRMHRHDEDAPSEHEVSQTDSEEAARDEESSLEELVASVVVVDEDDTDTPDSASIGYAVAESLEAQRSRPKSKQKRSRKPRRATRTFQEPQREEISEDPRAQQEKQDRNANNAEAEKSSAQRSEQTYEEAVAAFENSPRRKRRTRGNSRSDIRPKREDFAQEEAPAKDAQLATSKKEGKAERKNADSGVSTNARTSRGRGRRRVVRKMAQSHSAQTPNERGTHVERSTEAKEREGAARTGAPTTRRGGRGRRRVTRRRSR